MSVKKKGKSAKKKGKRVKEASIFDLINKVGSIRKVTFMGASVYVKTMDALQQATFKDEIVRVIVNRENISSNVDLFKELVNVLEPHITRISGPSGDEPDIKAFLLSFPSDKDVEELAYMIFPALTVDASKNLGSPSGSVATPAEDATKDADQEKEPV